MIRDKFNGGKEIEFEDLLKNDKIAIAMCRLHYTIKKENLKESTIKYLANYWKEHYNTIEGKGKAQDFIDKFNKYSKNLN